MNSKSFSKFSLALAVGALALVGSVRANTLTVNGMLTATSPTFNRPLAGTPPTGLSAVGTGVYYQLQPFYVTAATPFSLTTTAAALTPGTATDTFIVLYSTAFNPASPLTNALVADDDGGGNSLSLASATLAAGIQYFAVTTTFTNAATGTYTETFAASAATVVLGVVPEPSTDALLGVGILGGVALMMARRRETVTVAA